MLKLDIQMFADGTVEIDTQLNTKSFDAQIEELEHKLHELEKTADESQIPERFRRSADETRELNVEIERTRNKLRDLYKQQEKINQEGVKGFSSSIGKVTKKVTKWGLALFGIRSAYMFIRQSMSTLSQYNQDMANKIQVIKSALATSLEPLIKWIVDMAYQLVGLLGRIIKQWTGYDIFKYSAKSLKSGVKSAKELKKQLAGFDEMNVLQDNTKLANGGASGGAGKIPSFDKEFNVSSITDKIKDINNSIYDKLIPNIEKVLDYFGVDGKIVKNVKDMFNGLRTTTNGFWDILGGLGDIIVGFLQGDTDKVKDGFKKSLNGVKEVFLGSFVIMISQMQMHINTIWNLIKGIFEPVKDAWSKIFSWLNDKIFKPITDKINSIKNQIKKNFEGGFWKGIANTFIDIMNKAIDKLNSKLTISISSTIAKVLKAVKINVSAGKYQLFSIPKIPKLASGGIVNMPSRGVPIGNAIVGERGQEGVIPLTDSQQMALLGEAIGRYITINANITNTMNGRVISKELQKIQNEESFGFNR